MPRYKLSWWERNWWEVEIEAKDKLEAQQKFDNWDESVHDHCHESDDSFIDRSDLEIEEINANTNSIN